MWDRLRQADIEQAKQKLELRRAELFARHAREIDELAATQAEIENLHELIAAFALKFKPVARPLDEGPVRTLYEEPADAVVADEAAVHPVEPIAAELSAAPDADAEPEPEPALDQPSPALDQPSPIIAQPEHNEPPPAVAQAEPETPPMRPAPPPPPAPGDHPRTNFEVFRRAISNSSF